MSVDHSQAFHEVWKVTSHKIKSAVDTPAAVIESITPEGGERRVKGCSDTAIGPHNHELLSNNDAGVSIAVLNMIISRNF